MSQPVLAGLLLNTLAMTGLSLAMNKHHQQLLSGALPRNRARILRVLASCLLLLSLVLICNVWGIAAGIVLWLGLLSLAAIISVCLLNHLLFRALSLLTACVLVSVLLWV
ncbi:MAG TPA: DUF3325 domain-containing protein [Methylophaga sp.]|nr:DUF3325 domain-containing protein [Methylophaga sp.]